jgi:hypothetical protein
MRILYLADEYDMLSRVLESRGLEIEDVMTDPDATRRLVDMMPSADTCVSMVTEYHRNPQFEWKSNHIFDIDALSVAVPYCDIVVTDKQACDALHRAGVPSRMSKLVLRGLDELLALLES